VVTPRDYSTRVAHALLHKLMATSSAARRGGRRAATATADGAQRGPVGGVARPLQESRAQQPVLQGVLGRTLSRNVSKLHAHTTSPLRN
jgi:hypothetical protein